MDKEGQLRNKAFSRKSNKKMRLDDKNSKKMSFKQEDLHSYLLGLPPSVTHGAEADALALMRITVTLGEEFMDWVSASAKKICIVSPFNM